PILIAEKTGPHFAVGDTCYSHEEDVVTKNPDGKKIIARENEISAKRKEDPAGAYFNCHMDITIPYAELGAITAIHPDGTETDIIRDGLFRIKGAEELNTPLINK
ncbi:MAG: leucyl aminopeptidase, partial [Clostridiales bacterium]|nr:leucyl aminopeptidase [Clostridiales bacterium]